MKYFLILSSVLLFACQRIVKYKSLKYRELEMSSAATDITLPSKLWTLFDDNKVDSKDSEKLATDFMPIKVYLYERNVGVLGGQNHLLTYPSAGGELDLRDFVSEKNGSFYFAVEPVVKTGEGNLRIYFLSNSVERKLDEESYGSGCDTYFDITSAFQKAMKNEGFLLNTTGQRDVSAVAGTFFFVYEANKKLNISRLTIKDSRYPDLQCKR